MDIMLDHTRPSSGRKPPRLVNPSLSLLFLLAACGGGGGGGSGKKRHVNLASHVLQEGLLIHDDVGLEVVAADTLFEVNGAFDKLASELGHEAVSVDWAITSNINEDRLTVRIVNRKSGQEVPLDIRLAGEDSDLFKFVRKGQFFSIEFRKQPDATAPRDSNGDGDYIFEVRVFSSNPVHETDFDFISYRILVTDKNGMQPQQNAAIAETSVLEAAPVSVLQGYSRDGRQIAVLEGDNRIVLGEHGAVTARHFTKPFQTYKKPFTQDYLDSLKFQSLDVSENGLVLSLRLSDNENQSLVLRVTLVTDDTRSPNSSQFKFVKEGDVWKLEFRAAPDFEKPHDGIGEATHDNTYKVQMSSIVEKDGVTFAPRSRILSITVRNDPSDDVAASSAAGGRHLESGIYDETGLISDGGTPDVSVPDII